MLLAGAGFWGVPTSTVDWCEANYAHSFYVAEWWNTLSSVAMVAVGVVGAWLHRRVLEPRFLWAFALVSLVGLGSIAFHGTLLFQLQMLDELPMVYLVTLIVFMLVEHGPTRRFGAWFPGLLWAYVVIITVLCSSTRGQVEFYAFQISFGSLELGSLTRVWWIQRRLAPDARRVFRFGIATYLFAILIWFTDLKACGWLSNALPRHGIPNPQFHAWWHVLVSIGFYLLLLVIAVDREKRLGHGSRIALTPAPRLLGNGPLQTKAQRT